MNDFVKGLITALKANLISFEEARAILDDYLNCTYGIALHLEEEGIAIDSK